MCCMLPVKALEGHFLKVIRLLLFLEKALWPGECHSVTHRSHRKCAFGETYVPLTQTSGNLEALQKDGHAGKGL